MECGSRKNLHFDHDIPFSNGGSSLTAANVRFLCINVICLPRRSLGRDGQKLDKILSILRSNLLYVAGSGI